MNIEGSASANNTVKGNYIGTNAAGTAALGNIVGITINTPNNLIGGTTAADRNVISGNFTTGIQTLIAVQTNNTVQGNYIGTDAAGTAALGNASGLSITGSNNIIGGIGAGQANTIAFNSGTAIFVSETNAQGNSLRGNAIFSNGSGGIDLGANGVTANDALDPDTGANNLR